MIKITGQNLYDEGWVACYLGLPKDHNILRDDDLRLYYRGWNACHEKILDTRTWMFHRLKELGQIKVEWVEDK